MYAGALPEPMYHGGPKGHPHGHVHEEVPRGPALDVMSELTASSRLAKKIAGVKDPNSGGNTIYLSPGLCPSYDKWSSFVSVGVPVVNDLNGLQAESQWRVPTSVAINF